MPLPKTKVLVVDDDVDSAEALSLLLMDFGYVTRWAYDAPQALAAALDFEPDFAIIDLGLPGMCGFQLLDRLREQIELDHCRCVSVSAYAAREVEGRSRKAGFELHLSKPLELDALLEYLSRSVEREAIQQPRGARSVSQTA